ncbi:MAG: hypothetical protein BRD35_06390 [Bacteroidetes bacterium QH_7_62_13]|nr:MAG: hypothetical protein BRD35_06390 [Bacteroidetes bacterium QH_7_62_13]
MPDDRSDKAIETVADGLRLQVGDLPGDYAPVLLNAKPAAYVVGFTVGVSRAMDLSVGNHTIRTLERGTRQGLPKTGDLGQRLADIATRLILSGKVADDPDLVDLREQGEEEGRTFVEDRTPPSLLKDMVYNE